MEGGRRREKKWIRGLCGGESLMLDDSYYVHSHGKSLSFLPLKICLKENHYSGLILLVIVHQFPITALFILNNSVFRRKSFRIASAFFPTLAAYLVQSIAYSLGCTWPVTSLSAATPIRRVCASCTECTQ